jgi:DNA repair protein RecN (Recombination protein N)
MLTELRVRNYAVINDLRLELSPGLNVLTGETGAGKSLIVGALSLLLGERASEEVVRAGEDRALVEGVFDGRHVPDLVRECEAQGIAVDDGWLILRREVVRAGRNRAWVNGSPATASLVRSLGQGLVDLHGQHEHQALLRREAQRDILDAYAGAGDEALAVADAHGRLVEISRRIDRTRSEAAATRERSDYLDYLASEIEGAALVEGEDDAAELEVRRLEHSEELLDLSSALHGAVYGDDGSAVDALGELSRKMDDLVRIDPGAEELARMFGEARTTLDELGRRLSAYHNGVEHDPQRLAELRQRLDLIHRLKRKYGETIEAVLEAGRKARAELELADRSALDLEALEREREAVRADLEAAARRLTVSRSQAASKLQDEVTRLLPDLGMEGGRFEIQLQALDDPGPNGSESAEFLATLNPGFDPAPLSRIASGGEMSRVMLALKTALAEVDRIPSLVFDEIDSGIGGRVAHQVAEQLARVAASHQVFAVTHLPQIASKASVHLYVEKVQEEGMAAARVRALTGEDRVEELARMLGGDPGRETSRKHAEELLSE